VNELALFCGGGRGLLASRLLGWTTVCAVEREEYRRSAVLQRQRDGMLDIFPVWDDVNTFDGTPWRGLVDIVTGGFPCQDISSAGTGAGLAGSRSGLFFQMCRIIKEVEPRLVFAENSPNLRTRGLGTVVGQLAEMGYDCRWCVLGAWHLGAPHKRDRMWILAYPKGVGGWTGSCKDETQLHRYQSADGACASAGSRAGTEAIGGGEANLLGDGILCGEGPWADDSGVRRLDHGVPDRVERLGAAGDAQVPLVAAIAWQILSDGIV